MDIYHDIVTQAINGNRNYLGTEMRKVAIDWIVGEEGVNDNGEPISPRPLPTVEAMKKIVMRDMTATPPAEDKEQDPKAYSNAIFFWYYTKLLPIACGA